MNINETINSAVTDDMERMAYSLFWLVSKKFYSMEQDVNVVDFSKVDHDEVNQLIENDILKMKTPILLYSMLVKPKVFMLVLAADESDARGSFLQTYKRLPSRIDDITDKIDMDFHTEGKGYWRIRDVRNQITKFPHTVMIYDKNAKSADQVEHEYYQKFGRVLMTNEQKQKELEKGDLLLF